MPKQKRRLTNRVRNLIIGSALSAIILSVSTYAWFIGMRTVSVSSFEVEIASTESLLLSLDGKKWDTTVSISQGTLNQVSYQKHTNSWGGRGLIPMSSIGEMDNNASRMKLFEKASLNPTPGGYRLLASRVKNYATGAEEQEGYVVFDLFIKNISGPQYITELNPLDEESIYLTTDSSVTIGSDGVANTGIENSVRVAFTQIGRVIGTTKDDTKITAITCNADSETGLPSVAGDVTGICRKAQIWEPNDKSHVQNAINWYEKSCRLRKTTGTDVTKKDSYIFEDEEGDPVKCNLVENTKAYATYAVSNDIKSSDNVDVYDGAAYNGYTGSGSLLVPYDYFTDTEKELAGTARPPFMTLAPNSITKVRIYIYIEGQDVDNYDFASIGKQISVNFGFTKERLNPGDIGYDPEGPDLGPGRDTTKPVIELLGAASVSITKGEAYEDAGAKATDDIDGDITSKIVVVNPVDTAEAGTYYLIYNVRDWAGNYAEEVTRTVIVTDE